MLPNSAALPLPLSTSLARTEVRHDDRDLERHERELLQRHGLERRWHGRERHRPLEHQERHEALERHPGPHHSICPWLLDKKIHLWGVDMISTDHPMNLPIGRFLGRGGLEHWQRVRAQCEDKFGGSAKVDELFPAEAYQLTHNALFPHDCVHVENMGGQIGAPELQNRRIPLGAFPWLFKGGEAAFCRAVAFLEE